MTGARRVVCSKRTAALGLALALLTLMVGGGSAAAAPQTPPPVAPEADSAAFDDNGMWIWYVSKASGGSPARIAARAKAHGIGTVFIKSGDGASAWSQFTPALVDELKRRGLHVCAWHYVYGADPKGEARVSAEAAADGADCLVIDAESQYEGRYAQASTYIARLRAAVGPSFPLGLASFPYVHYHPGLPYSVFLGPGGAEFNLPQVYWRAIGTTVDKALATTYTYNRVYERPISPLGQLYMNPPRSEILRFRKLALADGFAGVSWWSWQHAAARGWRAVSRRNLRPPPHFRPTSAYPTLERGAAGDLVVWAQEHLESGGYLAGDVSGEFGKATEQATRSFQAAAGLPVTGIVDVATWQSLLDRLDPLAVNWRAGAARRSRGAGTSRPPPASASLPARADELGRRR